MWSFPDDLMTLVIVVVVSTVVSRVTNFLLKILFYVIIAIGLYMYFVKDVNAGAYILQQSTIFN